MGCLKTVFKELQLKKLLKNMLQNIRVKIRLSLGDDRQTTTEEVMK